MDGETHRRYQSWVSAGFTAVLEDMHLAAGYLCMLSLLTVAGKGLLGQFHSDSCVSENGKRSILFVP